jgi:prepilin-type N-terminal cleavage/methylation domain-containing protein
VRRRRQRGFTLIELMVAMVVSSLLVGMILAIFLRMSLAYRGQQQVAGLQQVLASARQVIESDAKHAGLMMPTGVKIAGGVQRLAPVNIVNSSTSPDKIRFLYADTSVQAAVTSLGPITNTVTVDDTTGWVLGSTNADNLVVISTNTGTIPNPEGATDAPIITYAACILKLTAIDTGTKTLTFDVNLPWGLVGTQTHCVSAVSGKTMIFKMVARAYRIDPTVGREADGVLQMSPTGDLFAQNDWQDMGYGFTDIQVATQFYDNDGIDQDGNLDVKREWYSAGDQDLVTVPADDATTLPAPLQMSISLVARTDKDVEGVASAATPDLRGSGNILYNTLGDRGPVDLTATADPALTGSRIFRYVTFLVDFRNTGIGR